ncbi:MAG: flagellar hook-basal body complex protein, partial [Phycisphaerae bacterium]|nr:flagellar hook-basal body complex protein [Phycisphaerae bacterium]
VVGNNIANVNTTAFKSSNVEDKPAFYITDTSGTASSSTYGGDNPQQRGMGAVVGSISKDFSNGEITSTGVNTDLAINGSGFFVVKTTNAQDYTRDGSFTLNDQNQLVTSSGDFVQGYTADSSGTINAGSLQNVTIPVGSLTQAKATTSASMQGNLNAGGQLASGASILNSQSLTDVASGSAATPTSTSLLTDLRSSTDTATPLFTVGEKITLGAQKGGRDQPAMSYTVKAGDTLATLNDFFGQAMGVDTTVAGSGTEAPGVTIGALTGDPANSARIIITGNDGTANALSISSSDITTSTGSATPFTFGDGTDTNGNTSGATGESVYTSFDTYDSLGNPVAVNLTAVLQSKTTGGTTWQFFATSPDATSAKTFTAGAAGDVLGEGTLSFDNSGKLLGTTGATLSIDRTGTGATSPMSVAVDFSKVTALSSTGSEIAMTKQDGYAEGTLSNFSVGSDGIITGTFTNGLTKTVGQVAIATFNNDDGLVDQGNNLYSVGADSGQAIVAAPGQLGAGTITAGALEASNVDLSKEFTKLITASTGFTASSRVISTADQLLTDLLNANR